MQDMSPTERARHYRHRAEELRTIASEWADSGTREVLFRVAKDYDHMAELQEKQFAPNALSHPS
jgi:hypothetical protein